MIQSIITDGHLTGMIIDGIKYTFTWYGHFMATTGTDGYCSITWDYMGQVWQKVCDLKELSVLFSNL